MKKIINIILVLTSFSIIAVGQNRNSNFPKQITISGYVSDTCLKVFSDSLILYFHDHYNDQLWREGKTIPVKVINNRFSVKIQPESQLSYFQLRDGRQTSNQIPSLKADAFLISAGDNIIINFKKPQEVSISGAGAEKLNYQRFAGKLALSGDPDWKSYTIKNQEQINYWRRVNVEHMKATTDSLNKIKSLIPQDAYNVLLYNTSAALNYSYLSHLTSVIQHNNFPSADSSFTRLVQNEIAALDNIQKSFPSTDPTILQYSSNYISYLGNFLLLQNKVMAQNDSVGFKQLFNKISNEYSGTLRDKLVTYVINKCYSHYGSSEFVSKALTYVKDSISKKILENVMLSKTPGVKAYDFSFEGVNGKQIKLKDLKGKVVVLEAWFNGCTGCVGLAQRMHPVIEHYKNNSNVVFISLCVDRDKERFLGGIKSGKYGSEYSTYAYTNGLGWEHPMCLKYQWSNFGYPQMIYIDKNGNLISAIKIDPVNESKKQELITMIDQHL